MRTLETNGLLSRILADQKGMEYVQSNKRITMLSTNNTVSGKPVFKNELEIEIIPGKQKLRQFITTRPTLQEMLKEVLKVEIKGSN